MPNKILKFSTNWNNKLNCTVFSTIRKHTHNVNIGDICDIELKGAVIKHAQCIHTEVMPFRDLNWATLAVDTGYLAGAITIFKNFGIDTDKDSVKILILKTI
jgi:hypothetical protein